MKRIISVLLMFMIIASITPVSASETDIEYFTIPVEYSDNIGNIEYLDIMVKNNNVYVNARMLAERMGFTYSELDEKVVFMNSDTSNGLPISFTSFSLNSTKVERRLFNSIVTSYEGPFTATKNDKGSWVPFEYSLLLNNSGMMITDEAILIDIPTKRIIDLHQDVIKYRQKYQFTWEDDFGYTGKDIDTLGKSSHLVNLFSGLLNFEGASWVSLFQQFAGSYESYDKKYGEDFATLLCTESDKELQETVDKIELMVDALDEDGQLGGALSNISCMKESQISSLYNNCEVALKNYKNGNSPLVTYNRTYQALEKSLDKQTWFSHVGENVLEVQKGLSSGAGKAFTLLDISSKLLKVCGYAQEFQHQDEFTVEALTAYLEKEKDGEDRLEQMKKSMLDYSKSLSTNVGQYTFQQFQNHIDEWIDSGVDISSQLGSQASIALFAWNLASNTIPFISNGLSSADSFELALYSGVFQDNAFLNYQDKRESIFSNDANITAENLYELTQYCYICLKSCYVTREAALASLANKSGSVKEKIQPLIDEQNNINKEIAKIIVELKGANATNEGGVYGFLPSDNQKYLKQYDDSHIVSWAKLKGKSSGATTQEVKPQADTGYEEKIDSMYDALFAFMIARDFADRNGENLLNDSEAFWRMVAHYATRKAYSEAPDGKEKLAEEYRDDEGVLRITIKEDEVRDFINAVMPEIKSYPPLPTSDDEKYLYDNGKYYLPIIDVYRDSCRIKSSVAKNNGNVEAVIEIFSTQFDFVSVSYKLEMVKNKKINTKSSEPYQYCIKNAVIIDEPSKEYLQLIKEYESAIKEYALLEQDPNAFAAKYPLINADAIRQMNAYDDSTLCSAYEDINGDGEYELVLEIYTGNWQNNWSNIIAVYSRSNKKVIPLLKDLGELSTTTFYNDGTIWVHEQGLYGKETFYKILEGGKEIEVVAQYETDWENHSDFPYSDGSNRFSTEQFEEKHIRHKEEMDLRFTSQ